MRKNLFFSAIALLALLIFSQTFIAQQTANDGVASTLTHERIESAKAKSMMSFFVNNANKKDHIFTKFNREDLIAALTAMPETDTVKFVMGAFTEDGPGRKRGKPVILLQLSEVEKTIPGGHQEFTYKYLQGNICPPPNGTCALEQ